MAKDRNTKLGAYTGPEELFKCKRGVIRPFGNMVKMQFDDGPDWLTQSWITFPAADVEIDNIQTLNAEELVVGDEDPLDFGCDSMLTEKDEEEEDADTN